MSDIMFGSFGNGVLVSDRSVIENGDYKKIAHISEAGNIKYYMYGGDIPEDVKERIMLVAREYKRTFIGLFETRTDSEQYQYILDNIPHSKFMEVVNDKRDYKSQLPELREYLYSIM